MATIREQLKKSKKLNKQAVSKDLFKFIRSIEKVLLELEKKRITEESKDIFGNPIGFYSPWTEALTGGRKSAGEPFTGVDSGEWIDGFYMQEVAGVLRFSSKDSKNSIILASARSDEGSWLSDQLFGLTDKDLKEVIQTRLLPFLLNNTRNILDI